MSSWKIIVPEGRTNMVLNPSAEIAGNYAVLGAAGISRTIDSSKFGLRHYECNLNGDNEGISLTLATLGAFFHYVTMYVDFQTDNAAWDWSLDGGVTEIEPTLIYQIASGLTFANYGLYGIEFTSAQSVGSTTLDIRQRGAGNLLLRLDGIQVEPTGTHTRFWTTYIDGDQEGCQWDGTPHASTSRRTSVSRAGGRVRDFQDDYGFNVGGMVGVGTVSHNLRIDQFALLPGGELNSDKLPSRQFTLAGAIAEDSWTDYHDKRSDLVAILAPQAYPEDARGPQEIRIWYMGAPIVKEISAAFEKGLDLRLSASRDPCFSEMRIGLQFRAADPLWYEIGNSSKRLDENNSLTVRYTAGRTYSVGRHGIWDDMSVGATTGGVAVYAEVVGPDGRLYVGGDFNTIDGVPNTLNIAVYDPLADTWAALGAGLENIGTNGSVRALAFGPDGTLYAGGDFDNAGADADADMLAQWDGVNWSAVGGAGARNGAVYAIIFDADGNLIIGGAFTDWMADGDADRVATWDGAAWGHLDDEEIMDGTVYTLALAPNGDIYIGGSFEAWWGPGDLRRICRWDGSKFRYVGTIDNNGVNSAVYAIAIDRSGQAYIGGAFTTARGETVNYITKWNGTMFEALGNGLGGTVRTLAFGPDEILWVGGAFSSMDDLGWVDRLARWKDSSWAAVDINLPGAPTVYTIALGNADPVIVQNYDVWIGFDTTGTAYMSGDAVVTHSWQTGGWLSYPTFNIERDGGTSARLLSVKNTSNGYELIFDYALRDGERLAVDLTPTRKSIVSGFYGDVPAAVLPNSDFGSFALLSRTNAIGYILAFADLVGAPTMLAWLEYRKAYESID